MSITDLIERALHEANTALEQGAVVAEEEPMKEASVGVVDPAEVLKVAAGLEFIGQNLVSLVDDRTDEEKVAEAVILLGQLQKLANEDIPLTPPLTSGVAPGAGGTALATDDGAPPTGGQTYSADGSKVNALPDEPSGTTKVRPSDSPTAMETDEDSPQEAIKPVIKMGGVPEAYRQVLIARSLDAASVMGKMAAFRAKLGMVPSPEGVGAVGENVPPAPEGEKGIATNEEAINLTKKDAVADLQAEVAKVLKEPAYSGATDRKLDDALDHASSAGTKLSSVARQTLEKVAEQGCTCNGSGTCSYCHLRSKLASFFGDATPEVAEDPEKLPAGMTEQQFQELRAALVA